MSEAGKLKIDISCACGAEYHFEYEDSENQGTYQTASGDFIRAHRKCPKRHWVKCAEES